jgi:phage gpG-like protein
MATVTLRNNIPKLNSTLTAALSEGLEKAGLVAEVLITAKIDSGLAPPLKEATIRAKGSSTVLIDTGELYGQITNEMEGKNTVKVGVIGSRAGIAAVHEFGSSIKNIPERSFIRSAIMDKSNQDKIGEEFSKKIKEAFTKSAIR